MSVVDEALALADRIEARHPEPFQREEAQDALVDVAAALRRAREVVAEQRDPDGEYGAVANAAFSKDVLKVLLEREVGRLQRAVMGEPDPALCEVPYLPHGVGPPLFLCSLPFGHKGDHSSRDPA